MITLAVATLMAAACAGSALGAAQISQLAGPNGNVNVISDADANGVRYIGGDFTLFNVWNTGNGAAFTEGVDQPNADFPKVSGGDVQAVVGDGSGGFFVGGNFTCIGALNDDGDCLDPGEFARNRVAHINADGSVADWNPNSNSNVYALAVSGSTVYAGGNFTTIGGQSRNRIAALDATVNTSNATAWNPNASSTVYALAVSGSTVYAAGNFTTIGGQSRNRIAALDATVNTSNATAWNPNASSTVYALAVSGSTVYAGGDFSTIGGESRSRVAALDATGNTATAWNPSADNTVYALAVSGSTVYAGGNFTTIGGQSRNRVAALDATVNTSNASSWNPNVGNAVNALAVSGHTVYIGGSFTALGGESRARLAALDADGYLTSWNPIANGGVKTILLDGSTLYIGGEFSSIGGTTRRGLAALGTDGTLGGWDPGLNSGGSVRRIVKAGTDLFFGGYFTSVSGVTRGNIAAVSLAGSCATNAISSCVKSWDPATTGAVRGADVNTLVQVGTTILMGGPFSTVGGVTREGAAAVGIDSTCLDSYTGACVLSWNPGFGERVNTIAVLGDVAYIGGWFDSVSASMRSKLAGVKVDSSCLTSWSSGSCLTAWNPGSGNAVNALAVSGSTLYVGGTFTTMNGTSRDRLASIDVIGACATTFSNPCLGSWNPQAANNVTVIRVAGSNVYLGGEFQSVGGVTRSRLALVGTNGTLGAAIGLSAPVAPSAPVFVTATLSGQVATVAFAPAYNGGSSVIQYTATCTSSTGGTTRTGTAAATTVTVSDLTPGATYTCAASATNAMGTSASSAASSSFTVAGGGGSPSDPDSPSPSPGSGSSASATESPQSATQAPGVSRLTVTRRASRVPGRVVTVGIVPSGATSVVQVARSGSAATGLSRRARANARVVTSCPITAKGDVRTFTCSARLGAGTWVLTTQARNGATVVASSTRRVVVKATKRTAVPR